MLGENSSINISDAPAGALGYKEEKSVVKPQDNISSASLKVPSALFELQTVSDAAH